MKLLNEGKILVFDIETSDFKANFGYMLMWAAKFVGEDHVWCDTIADNPDFRSSPDAMMDDRRIVESLRDTVNEADALVAHYGSRFDLPFLNTRCLEHGIAPPVSTSMIDTWRVARSQLAMTSNRLGTLGESFADPENQKGGMSKRQWKLAVHGCQDTLDEMLEYCIQDVTTTEEVYLKLLPVIKHHPFVGPAPQGRPAQESLTCPVCGSMDTQGHDSRRTKNFAVFRRRCKNCGSAFESARKKLQ
jgi:DNA polymerase elongation subunit (family B)